MQNKKSTSRRAAGSSGCRRSFVLHAINAFSAFLYSLFANGRVGSALSSGNGLYKKSLCARLFERNAAKNVRSRLSGKVERAIEDSRALRAVGVLRVFLGSLAINVYGIFFVAYGLTSVFMYYITIVLNGKNDHGMSALITSVIITVCALPMLVSSKSVTALASESAFIRRFIVSFLGIPEEKLKQGKRTSGTEYMFMSAIIAVLFGIFTYFLHACYLPIILGVLILLCLISVTPEAGVMISIAASPFLQYTSAGDVLLIAMILVTMVSYVSKLIRHRRTASFSAESVFVLIFCGFMIAAGIFSKGGAQTARETLFTVLVILGGFFMTYNLMRGKRKLSACTAIVAAAFAVPAVMGVWNFFYQGIADGVMYSMRANVQPIFDGGIVYVADSSAVFSVLAVLASPLIFSYAAKQKSMKGLAAVIILITFTSAASIIYGTYETVVAIILEFCLFWMLYSHRTLTVIIIALIPLATFTVAYPYLANQFGWKDISETIKNILPLAHPDSATYNSVVQSVVAMLKDGNLSGIGAGKHAFEVIYPAYADVVSASAVYPGSFWLQIVCWSGIGGLVTFLLFSLTLLKNSLGYLVISRDKMLRREALALMCGLFVSMIYGAINCLWDDPRMMYLFWVMAGLLAGYIREGIDEERMRVSGFADDTDHTDVELKFYR